MNRRQRLLALVVTFVAAGVGLVPATPATTGGAVDASTTSSLVTQRAADVTNYWTPDRMKRARPYTPKVSDAPAADAAELDSV